MRVLIPLAAFTLGCVLVAIGAFILSPPVGLIVAGSELIFGSFTWGYVEVGQPADELKEFREAA